MGYPSNSTFLTLRMASSSKALIRAIGRSVKGMECLHLVICNNPMQALTQTQKKGLLVLLHVTRATDAQALTQWVQQLTATNAMVATVSSGNDFHKDIVSKLLADRASDHLEWPLDSNKSNGLVEAASLRTGSR